MNWYKNVLAQFKPNWQRAKNKMPAIRDMIQNWGSSKGIDPNEIQRMIQEAESYLTSGHDIEKVRSIMQERLRAA